MAKPKSALDAAAMARTVTRHILPLVFLAVFFLSLITSRELTWSAIAFGILKGALAGALGWIFIFIVSDAVIRSIRISAVEAEATRRDGGILYHFLPPDPDEIAEDPPAASRGKKRAKKA